MTDHIRTPRNMVTGVLAEPDRLDQTLEALESAGFNRSRISVVFGEDGLASVDPTGRAHGLVGRVVRTLEQFGLEGEEHRAASAELRAGHLLVAVPAPQPEDKDRAETALRGQGLRRLRYWGPWDIEALSP